MLDRPHRPDSLRPLRLALGASLLLAAALPADRVVLVNGRVFDDVVAVVGDGKVEVRMGGGSLTLPRNQIASIETASSAVEEYAARAAALEADASAGASSWLDLALWAGARGYDFGLRQAALAAAELDPDFAGVAPILRRLGYELDEESGRWLAYDDAMRRRGWIEDGGEWVPPGVAGERERARQIAREEQRRAADTARLDRLTALAEMRLASSLATPDPYYGYDDYYWNSWGGWGIPVFVPFPTPLPHPPHSHQPPSPGVVPTPPAPRSTVSSGPSVDILTRQPGSLFPVSSQR